jgi:protein-tyrosine phosphatase
VSVNTEIQRIKNNISSAYASAYSLGATAVTNENSENLAGAIATIPTGIKPIAHTWQQMPTAVKNFIENVTYDPADYSVSRIEEYAPSTVNASNTYSVGKSVSVATGTLDRNGYEQAVTSGDVVLYNDIPNKHTEYTVRNNGVISQVGTLKPTGVLRQIKCNNATNVRDLGGWACDGGTIKYGKLIRGGLLNSTDRQALVEQCGIMHEIDLRGIEESNNLTASPLGDDVGFTLVEGNNIAYNIQNKSTWKQILRVVFDCAIYNKPLYFHCAAGRDRTGTVACIIEAILGVSQSNIDKDYELTCFSLKTNANTDPLRTKMSWSGTGGLIPMINALTVGSTFRDKVLYWVASMGFTVAEINAFRKAMIDGTPDIISLNIANYSITKSLNNASLSNTATSIDQYQAYETDITPDSGYEISEVTVTMGGVDITDTVFSGTYIPESSSGEVTNITVEPLEVTANGTYTAENGKAYSPVTVNVTSQQTDIRSKCWHVNVPSNVMTGNFTFVSGDSDIAKHYADTTAVALFFKLGGAIVGNTHPLYCVTNNNFGLGNIVAANLRFNSAGTSLAPNTDDNILTNPSHSLKADANGNLQFYGASSSYGIGAGDYVVVFAW